ncbi:TBC1D23 [Mytilus edulis]|uniref:TBC1D23 n=1 Tax=Mytilus edulis TaxID=6550 RepID=A0A8S3QCV9_MYTED|nr:TBC1D23 [Mytilus edulis]
MNSGKAKRICLGVHGKGDSLATFDGLFDLKEQEQIRQDCKSLIDKFGNEDEEDKLIVLETIITFARQASTKYMSFLTKETLLGVMGYIVRRSNEFLGQMDCEKNGKPFHLFRLLLQYHDPELSSFLDTKRITPDTYALPWLRSLFASTCTLPVIQTCGMYISSMEIIPGFLYGTGHSGQCKKNYYSKMEICYLPLFVEVLTSFPSGLEAEDIEDFCSLSQYYASKTPQSFRRDYQGPLFGASLVPVKEEFEVSVTQALCLPVSVAELLQACQPGAGDGVKYFVVDCRPAEQYNNGHLPTAFHLDANLMLQNPMEFNTAVQALLAAQQQSINAGSISGGEHLCFIGSGREEEDQYVYMVIANFLQKHYQFISFAKGGYSAVHQLMKDRLSDGLTNHNSKLCIICNPEAASSDLESGEDFHPSSKNKDDSGSLFGKLSGAVKSKSAEMKQKLTDYIKNENQQVERHVSNTDRVGKRYRNMDNVFSIGDDEDDELPNSSDEDSKEKVSLDTWLKKPDIIYSCKCNAVGSNGFMFPSYILVTDNHMYILREIPIRKGMAHIQSRRALGSIVKITSKKRHPELITFKYGSLEDESVEVTDMDRFLIPNAGEATKKIKQQIVKVLDALDR